MARTISLAEHVEVIDLAEPPQGGALGRVGRRLHGLVGRGRGDRRRLVLSEDGLLVVADGGSGKGLEIPWEAVRKATIDDGSRWGYVSGVCRFPVYDVRDDGSGSGVLIGPLWSHASSLMPEWCPVEGLEPVPSQAPNLALILEPRRPGLRSLLQDNGGRRSTDAIALLLLRVQDPDLAREALATRDLVGELDHDDLGYLGRAAGEVRPDQQARSGDASAASA